MERTLRAAGLPNRILEEIPKVVKTCRECRMWQTPAPASQTTATLPEKFNEHVEADILFYRTYMICHCICRASRWHAGRECHSKTERELLDCLHGVWIGTHGPMVQLYIDGESGLNTDSAKASIGRDGTILKTRAPGQHARFIERRGAILRVCLHVTEEQAKREGLTISFEQLLATCIFAGNAMITVGNATPYQCVYGRQPPMMPPIENPDFPDSENDRVKARIRDIGPQSMIQASALARTRRATTTRSSSSGQGMYQPGDLVDYFRKPSAKDVSGWKGPVPVVRNSPSDGQVILDIHGRHFPSRYQDVRRTLLVIHTFLSGLFSQPNNPSSIVIQYVNNMHDATSKLFGLVSGDDGRYRVTAATKEEPRVAAALSFLTRNHLMLVNVVAVRLARTMSRLARIRKADTCFLYWWPLDSPRSVQIADLPNDDINCLHVIGPDFQLSAMMQVFMTDLDADGGGIAAAIDAVAGAGLDPAIESDASGLAPDTTIEPASHDLPPIAEEGDADDTWFNETLSTYFAGRDDIPEEDLREACKALYAEDLASGVGTELTDPEIPVYAPPQYDHLPDVIHEYAHYIAAGVSTERYLSDDVIDDAGNQGVELYYSREMSKCLLDDTVMCSDEHAVIQIYKAGPSHAVIQRDTDLLTNEEIKQHKPAVEAAILEELRTWVKHETFVRAKRTQGMNVMTSRFIAKWKVTVATDGTRTRIIRMRMALRGFQDWYAHLHETYSGTATRVSQRILCSETACRENWVLITVDVAKAFPQRMTYKELQEATGEPERFVHFVLPTGSAAVLRQIPGYENYDERYECLRCVKPGTGTKEAPRAFSLKLSKVTRSRECGFKPCTIDPELEVKHAEDGRLVAMLSKHVDDIKFGGERAFIDKTIVQLEKVFGKLAYHEQKFTNTGMRHQVMPDGSIQLDQDEYIQALKPIAHPDLIGAPADTPAPPHLQEAYGSLLGALAYAVITQFQLSVYVVHLQRNTHNPNHIHLRRLNAVVRAAQRRPARILYRAMSCSRLIEAHSDSGFSREADKGYGLRGANFLRAGSERSTGKKVWHMIDSACKSHKRVTRSTFSAETLAAVDTADDLIPLVLTLHEVIMQPGTAERARRLREHGGFCFQTTLVIDALSLWSAVAAANVRVPTEKNLAVHLFWLRELLDNGILDILRWADTRDMSADGHTKGSIPRDAILSLMNGLFQYAHATKDFTPKIVLLRKSYHDPTSGGDGNHPYAHPKPGSPLWHKILKDMYRRHAPRKLPRFEQIFAKYYMNEKELHDALILKYEGDPKTPRGTPNRDIHRHACRLCGEIGHWGNECPMRMAKAKSKAKKEETGLEPAPPPMPPPLEPTGLVPVPGLEPEPPGLDPEDIGIDHDDAKRQKVMQTQPKRRPKADNFVGEKVEKIETILDAQPKYRAHRAYEGAESKRKALQHEATHLHEWIQNKTEELYQIDGELETLQHEELAASNSLEFGPSARQLEKDSYNAASRASASARETTTTTSTYSRASSSSRAVPRATVKREPDELDAEAEQPGLDPEDMQPGLEPGVPQEAESRKSLRTSTPASAHTLKVLANALKLIDEQKRDPDKKDREKRPKRGRWVRQ